VADTPEPSAAPAAPIVARASGEYRFKRFALVVLLFGYGLWSGYDGFVKMPADNAKAAHDHPGTTKLPHPAYDIPFNRAFGIALPPLSLLLLGWSMYHCRGEYRLDADDTLRLPGHPPVPLSSVTAIDRGKWDRKGIAYLDYQLPDGTAGRATLDDFIYQREPTDRIFDRVMAAVEGPAVATPEPEVEVAPAVEIAGPDGGDPTPG